MISEAERINGDEFLRTNSLQSKYSETNERKEIEKTKTKQKKTNESTVKLRQIGKIILR